MNGLLIGVCIFLLASIIDGYRKGFIKKAFTIFSFVVTIIAASFMMPYVSHFIKENTPLYDGIRNSCEEIFGEEYEKADRREAVEDAGLPGIIDKLLSEGDVEETLTEAVAVYFSREVADIIVNGISFFTAFAIITFVLRTTVFTLDIIANLPIIRGINQYSGLLLGAAEGIIWIWVFFMAIAIINKTEAGIFLMKYIQESEFLSFLYNNNYFFKLLK